MRRTYSILSILMLLLVCLLGSASVASAQCAGQGPARLGQLPAGLDVCRPLQFDLSGLWTSGANHEERPIRGDPGVEAGEYVGLPINEAARQHGDAWVPAMHSLPEWQARPHPITYSMRAPGPSFRLAPIIDPGSQQTVAYTLVSLFGRADRIIWLDGRPHPSKYAEHLWQGFSTGEFLPDGTLKVLTTHIKYSFVHRNGLPLSPYAQMTEYFKRHGDIMMLAIIVDDPIYLTEPLVRTSTFRLNPTQDVRMARPFEIFDEIPALSRGRVPANLLGFVDTRYAEINGLPLESVRGGAHTALPEYAEVMKQLMTEMQEQAAAEH